MSSLFFKELLKRITGNYKKAVIFTHYTKFNIAKKFSQFLNNPHIIIVNEINHPKNLTKYLKNIINSSDLIIECWDSNFLNKFENKLEKYVLKQKRKLLLLLDWKIKYFNKKYFNENYKKLKTVGKKILKIISNTKDLEIRGKNIHIILKPDKIKWHLMDGICKPGTITQFPDGEIFCCSKKIPIKYFKYDPHKLKIEKGVVYDTLHRTKLGRIIELGIGINPILKGNENIVSFDEKALTTIHLGINGFNGHHYEIIFKNIELKIDGKKVNLFKKFTQFP